MIKKNKEKIYGSNNKDESKNGYAYAGDDLSDIDICVKK